MYVKHFREVVRFLKTYYFSLVQNGHIFVNIVDCEDFFLLENLLGVAFYESRYSFSEQDSFL